MCNILHDVDGGSGPIRAARCNILPPLSFERNILSADSVKRRTESCRIKRHGSISRGGSHAAAQPGRAWEPGRLNLNHADKADIRRRGKKREKAHKGLDPARMLDTLLLDSERRLDTVGPGSWGALPREPSAGFSNRREAGYL